jgi:hypothetical protein
MHSAGKVDATAKLSEFRLDFLSCALPLGCSFQERLKQRQQRLRLVNGECFDG